MPLRDVAGDCQPETGATGVGGPGCVQPAEALKDQFPIFGGDSGTVIGHREHGGIARFLEPD